MVDCSIKPNSNRIVLQGELNFDTVVGLYSAGQRLINSSPPASAGGGKLEFDLAAATAYDSAALVLLLAWMRDAKHCNKLLHFSNVPKKLLDLASISGLEDVLKKE